jgi:hypothetical protein
VTTFLSRDAILGADDRRYEIVEVVEWGGAVKLRSLTGTERDDFEAKSVVGKGENQRMNYRNMRARLVTLSAVDEQGEPLFNQADVIKLGSKSAAALDRLFDAARKLSGIGDDDVKELEEGFDDAQSEPSISA